MEHHVIVTMPSDKRPSPGLLLEWEKRDGQWWGHVWVLHQSNAHKPYDSVSEVWYPADRLTPVNKAHR